LNAGLLDRLGEAVGAAPRHGEDIQRVSFFSNSADEEENAVQEVGRDAFVATTKKKSALAEKPSFPANVLQDSEVKGEQTHEAHEVSDEAFFEGASSVTRKRDVLRALESEVKLLDAEYRETIEAIKRANDFAGGDLDRRRLNTHTIEVDALAARANSLEDAIVRKVEEVQRLRDDVFGVSRKIEL
jgi:stress-induced morphogen